MVDELLVKFDKILASLKKDKVDVSLFALLKMDDLVDSWSVLVSKPDLKTLHDRRILFQTVVKLLVKHLDEEELDNIARVGAFPENDHLVSDVLKYKKGHVTQSFKANGNFVHEAYILESKT